MRSAGIDYGEARIGIAFSDPKGVVALPHKTLRALKILPETAQLIATELKAYAPLKQIVIGLPLLLSGRDSPLSIKVRQLAELLKVLIPDVPVLLWDERLTTAGLERSLKDLGVSRKKRQQALDPLAAAAILQNYLDWESRSK
jgi:putative Holliday junction resolvase